MRKISSTHTVRDTTKRGSIVNILLINPETPDTFWSFKTAIKFISKRSSEPPLGLITVAAMLPVAWDKRLIDLNIESLIDQDIHWADMVFIGGMSIQRASFENTAERCKRLGKVVYNMHELHFQR